MGLAATFVLVCSNVLVSALRKVIPAAVHIPCYIVIIATFVTAVDLLMQAYLPDLSASLGIFIPLIVVNCIILGRAEAFACKHTPLASIFDGIGIGLGFTMALTFLGMVRELFGAGSLFGATILPETSNVLLFVLPPGAFISLGFLTAIMGRLSNK
jgi:electron transport complex protein RnfE